MSFQRSYSKVWWGSDNQLMGSSFTSGGYYSNYTSQPQQQQQQQQPVSYDAAQHRANGAGNLSSIQEVEDEQNSSKLSWHKQDSPGSLRSQDSGFSDNEESHSSRTAAAAAAGVAGVAAAATAAATVSIATAASPSPTKSNLSSAASTASSPRSLRSVGTPPTVIRRVGNSAFYSPLVNVTRRISFSEAHTPDEAALEASRSQLFEQLDSLQFGKPDAAAAAADADANVLVSDSTEEAYEKRLQQLPETPTGPVSRRRKRVVRKSTQPLSPTYRRNSRAELMESFASDEDSLPPPPEYNNETVYLGDGEAPPPYHNETVTFGQEQEHNETLKFELSPLRLGSAARFTASTSTPKAARPATATVTVAPLSDVAPPLGSWLAAQRWSCEQEVMCMLQTKSVAQAAYKNFKITTSSVAKLIRQLQQQALALQLDFERNERLLSGVQPAASLQQSLGGATQLLEHLGEFTRVLERRAIFFNEARQERRKYEQQLEQIRDISKDTGYSLARQHYINLESLLDDLQLLKRHTLITVRQIFERLVRLLVQSIEQSGCDLLLRANINMVATLMSIDYDGFASLTDAFVQSEAVRTLLVIVLDHKLSSVRALALRALATLCCAPEAIAQLGCCGGIELVRDILQEGEQRSGIERREAVSLLVQLTAAWHGAEHRVSGLKGCAESLVAGLAALLTPSCCAQTLLLCCAALNNLSRMEHTSHYSIMSNEAIFKLIDTLQQQQQQQQESSEPTVFLYEQIVGMLYNMSLNKKCHSHLANGVIISFITCVYQTEFYKTYGSRAECDAQRRCVKSILHSLTRLVQDSPTLGAELLEQWQLPELLQMSLCTATSRDSTMLDARDQATASAHSRDIAQLARQLLHAHRQEQTLLQATTTTTTTTFSSGNQTPEAQTRTAATAATAAPPIGLKFNLTRQESFV